MRDECARFGARHRPLHARKTRNVGCEVALSLEPDEDVAFFAGYQEQIGGQLLLILLDDAASRGGVARLDRGLEAGQIRNQPSLAGKVFDADPAVFLDQASGLVEAAEELLFGLSGDGDGDVVDANAD